MEKSKSDRYGSKKSLYAGAAEGSGKSRRYLVIISLLAVVGIGITAWFTFSNPQTYIEHHVVSFEPLNDHQLRLQFQVGLPTDQQTVCGIQALSENKAIVGYREVEVPTSTRYLRSYDLIIETVEPAVTGLISYCFPE